LKGSTASIGDTLLISVKSLRLKVKKKTKAVKITKGDILKGVVIRTKYSVKNTIGSFIRFDENAIIILNNQENPMGTRIFGPITNEFRKRKNLKILSLSSNIL